MGWTERWRINQSTAEQREHLANIIEERKKKGNEKKTENKQTNNNERANRRLSKITNREFAHIQIEISYAITE